MQVERAQNDAKLARQRFMDVDLSHRRVATGLETDWNAKLSAHQDAQEHCDARKPPIERL
jgi:hypothetical protein